MALLSAPLLSDLAGPELGIVPIGEEQAGGQTTATAPLSESLASQFPQGSPTRAVGLPRSVAPLSPMTPEAAGPLPAPTGPNPPAGSPPGTGGPLRGLPLLVSAVPPAPNAAPTAPSFLSHLTAPFQGQGVSPAQGLSLGVGAADLVAPGVLGAAAAPLGAFALAAGLVNTFAPETDFFFGGRATPDYLKFGDRLRETVGQEQAANQALAEELSRARTKEDVLQAQENWAMRVELGGVGGFQNRVGGAEARQAFRLAPSWEGVTGLLGSLPEAAGTKHEGGLTTEMLQGAVGDPLEQLRTAFWQQYQGLPAGPAGAVANLSSLLTDMRTRQQIEALTGQPFDPSTAPGYFQPNGLLQPGLEPQSVAQELRLAQGLSPLPLPSLSYV